MWFISVLESPGIQHEQVEPNTDVISQHAWVCVSVHIFSTVCHLCVCVWEREWVCFPLQAMNRWTWRDPPWALAKEQQQHPFFAAVYSDWHQTGWSQDVCVLECIRRREGGGNTQKTNNTFCKLIIWQKSNRGDLKTRSHTYPTVLCHLTQLACTKNQN